MVVPGSMVSVVPDVTNTWSVRTYLYAANCGSGSAIGSTNQHGGSVTLETCLKDQVRAYPGLRVDVATDVDHVLEGLCVSRRHGQLRVAMGTERGVPIKTSSGARLTGQGFQGFRGSEFPLISAGGTPRGALCAACCASETLAARLGSAEVFGDDDPGCRRETPAKRHADGDGKSTTSLRHVYVRMIVLFRYISKVSFSRRRGPPSFRSN